MSEITDVPTMDILEETKQGTVDLVWIDKFSDTDNVFIKDSESWTRLT